MALLCDIRVLIFGFKLGVGWVCEFLYGGLVCGFFGFHVICN